MTSALAVQAECTHTAEAEEIFLSPVGHEDYAEPSPLVAEWEQMGAVEEVHLDLALQGNLQQPLSFAAE